MQKGDAVEVKMENGYVRKVVHGGRHFQNKKKKEGKMVEERKDLIHTTSV